MGLTTLVAAQPAGAPRSPALENVWADLATADEVKVALAILSLSKNPNEALAYLKQNLPAVKADPKRVAQLVADLDSNQFAVRQKAVEGLEYLGKYIKEDLEKALAKGPPIETKQRLQELLDRMPKPVKDPKPLPPQKPGQGISVSVTTVNGQQQILVNGVPVGGAPAGPATPVGPPMSWVRAVRAIALLEHIGTSEAKQILETLASGEEDALPTQQAKAALERLGKK
jgi:hypothetical protein